MPQPTASLDPAELARVRAGDHDEPHRVLGAHPAQRAGVDGSVVRAFHPDAIGCDLILDVRPRAMESKGGGVFETFIPGMAPGSSYRVCFRFDSGASDASVPIDPMASSPLVAIGAISRRRSSCV